MNVKTIRRTFSAWAIAAMLTVVCGCAAWEPKLPTTEGRPKWGTRSNATNLFGVDQRAREIENNLGVR